MLAFKMHNLVTKTKCGCYCSLGILRMRMDLFGVQMSWMGYASLQPRGRNCFFGPWLSFSCGNSPTFSLWVFSHLVFAWCFKVIVLIWSYWYGQTLFGSRKWSDHLVSRCSTKPLLLLFFLGGGVEIVYIPVWLLMFWKASEVLNEFKIKSIAEQLG